jgi:hypothetical protein
MAAMEGLPGPPVLRCSKIAEAEAAMSVNEKNRLVMHMHVQLRLNELALQACGVQQLVYPRYLIEHLNYLSAAVPVVWMYNCCIGRLIA